MKTKLYYLFFILVCHISTIQGQNNAIAECFTTISTTRASTNCSLNDIFANENVNTPYIPNVNSSVLTVRLNLHVMQDNSGINNFQNNATQRAYLNQLVADVNVLYSNIQPPIWNGYTNDPYIGNSKIQFRIENIYFHQDSYANQHAPADNNNYTYNNYGVNKNSSINVFFCGLSGYTNIAGQGYGLNGESLNFIGLYGYYYNYINYPSRHNICVFNFSHELGHALGLMHTFQPDELSDTYLPDVGSWCNCLSNLNCSNNIMGGSSSQANFSPLQVAKMRRLLTVGWRAKLVDNCFYNEPMKYITTSETWDLPRMFSSDITIKDGATVSLLCKVYLPQQKKIIVDKNSKLIIDGGSVLNIYNQPVSIEVKEGGYLEISSSAVLDKCNINVLNKGSLKLSGPLTLTNGSNINIYLGAYFCFLPSANLSLVDDNTALNLYYGYISGINTTYFPGLSSGCVSSINSLVHSGNGKIKNYTSDLYIQNETITTNQYYIGRNIYVGYNVTTSKPQGNVIITNNANVIFEASENVNFEPGFECALGSTFEVVSK